MLSLVLLCLYLGMVNARCPFGVPSFNCTAYQNQTRPLSIPVAEISRVVANTSSSSYLNFAAPFLNLFMSEIDSMAIIGDSVSAGLFVTNSAVDIFNLSPEVTSDVEHRRFSWSNGGADRSEILTLFNLMKEFSPNLYGASYGSTKRKEDSNDKSKIGLNVAVSSQQSFQAPAQADKYVEFLKEKPDIAKKWKMVNILIGANDMCRFCQSPGGFANASNAYEQGVRDTIERLRLSNNSFVGSKMLINLFGTADLSPFNGMGSGSITCSAIRKLSKSCPCILGDVEAATLNQIRLLHKQFNDILKKISKEYQLKYLQTLLKPSVMSTHDGAFVVFYQPAFADLSVTGMGLSFVSSVDCFHLNYCGQQALTISAFNALSLPTEEDKRQSILNIIAVTREFYAKTGETTGRSADLDVTMIQQLSSGKVDWVCPARNGFIQ